VPETPVLTLERGADPYAEAIDAADPVDKVDRSALVVRNDLEIENMPPIAWLADHVIPRGSLSVLYGAPGSGKSFVALDLAFSIAAGVQWLGRTALAGGALYVAAEGLGGLGQRVAAWKHARGFAGQQLGVGFVTNAVDMLEVANSARIIQATEHVRSPVRLVVIDTLARSMVGDENDTRDMGKFVAAADRIREATGAAVLVLHHTRKDSDVERGNTQLRGAVDTLILCAEEDDGRQLVCQKQKDAEAFEPMSFRLAGGHGSCVVEGLSVSTMAAPPDVVSDLTPKRLKVLEALAKGFTGTGASATDWQEAADISRRTFFRVRTWLVSHGFVQEKGHRYSVTLSGKSAVSAKGANSVPNASANMGRTPPKGGSALALGTSDTGTPNGTNPDLFEPTDREYADSLAAEIDERLGMQGDG
jgi:hypothetical protein